MAQINTFEMPDYSGLQVVRRAESSLPEPVPPEWPKAGYYVPPVALGTPQLMAPPADGMMSQPMPQPQAQQSPRKHRIILFGAVAIVL